MASAEHEPITGVQGQSPWSGGQGAKPPEAESILVTGCPTERANLAPFQKMHLYFYSRCNGNHMGKIYVEIQGGQVTPLAPSWRRPCLEHRLF